MKKCFLILIAGMICIPPVISQSVSKNLTNTPKIQLPDIPGYYTLKCDFHMHTVFSDGVVWPSVRVEEALAEGLDVISITDHVEYSPKKQVEPDKAIGYQMALNAAQNKPLIVIPGGEISATPDHFNALFLTDQNVPTLKDKDPVVRIGEAVNQGGFVFWNHPGWTSRSKDGMAPVDQRFYDMMKEGKIKGIEIANGVGYWQECFEICEKYKLAFIGNSDIHGISHYAYTPDIHRTVTLLFATEKTPEAVEEALLESRTLVYQGDHLIGRNEFLDPLFKSCLEIKTVYSGNTTLAAVIIKNISDIDFHCENLGDFTFYNGTHFFTLPAHSTTTMVVKTIDKLDRFNLDLKIHNLVNGPGESLETTLALEVTE